MYWNMSKTTMKLKVSIDLRQKNYRGNDHCNKHNQGIKQHLPSAFVVTDVHILVMLLSQRRNM